MKTSHNPFSGELKGKLINKQEDKSNFFEDNFVPNFIKDENGTYIFSLKDNEDVIFKNVPLATLTADPISVDNKKYLSVYEIKVNQNYKQKGIATNIYRYIMLNLPKGFSGIYSPSETRANDLIIPKIYEKLSKEFTFIKDDNGNFFLAKKS
jgi:hypothetical protein